MNGTPSIAGVPYKTNNYQPDKIQCKETQPNVNNSPNFTLQTKAQRTN
jgi:hypothetical protein